MVYSAIVANFVSFLFYLLKSSSYCVLFEALELGLVVVGMKIVTAFS